MQFGEAIQLIDDSSLRRVQAFKNGFFSRFRLIFRQRRRLVARRELSFALSRAGLIDIFSNCVLIGDDFPQ